jgi:hypothetical protein
LAAIAAVISASQGTLSIPIFWAMLFAALLVSGILLGFYSTPHRVAFGEYRSMHIEQKDHITRLIAERDLARRTCEQEREMKLTLKEQNYKLSVDLEIAMAELEHLQAEIAYFRQKGTDSG